MPAYGTFSYDSGAVYDFTGFRDSLFIQLNGSNIPFGVQQDIINNNLIQDTEYSVSFVISSSEVAVGGNLTFLINGANEFSLSANDLSLLPTIQNGGPGWIRLRFRFKTPQTLPGSFLFKIESDGNFTAGNVFIDDIKVNQLNTLVTKISHNQNKIKNSLFDVTLNGTGPWNTNELTWSGSGQPGTTINLEITDPIFNSLRFIGNGTDILSAQQTVILKENETYILTFVTKIDVPSTDLIIKLSDGTILKTITNGGTIDWIEDFVEFVAISKTETIIFQTVNPLGVGNNIFLTKVGLIQKEDLNQTPVIDFIVPSYKTTDLKFIKDTNISSNIGTDDAVLEDSIDILNPPSGGNLNIDSVDGFIPNSDVVVFGVDGTETIHFKKINHTLKLLEDITRTFPIISIKGLSVRSENNLFDSEGIWITKRISIGSGKAEHLGTEIIGSVL